MLVVDYTRPMYCQTVSNSFPTYSCIPLFFFFNFSLPPVCDFDMVGPDGYVESVAISAESRALPTEAVDCRWYIRAPPKSKVRMGALSVGEGKRLGQLLVMSIAVAS